jgi:hypothetical protein
MTTNSKLIAFSFGVSLLLTACGSQNPDRQAPPEKFTAVTIEGSQTKSVADPKVNVLFVVDNSQSMDNYQSKMAKNIELFAEHFFANPRIDYRIGVVPIYDSKYLNDQTVYRSGKRKMNALGHLVPLKGLAGSQSNRLYITRETPNPIEVLKQTVVIGTQWGPEAEESFSPVVADKKNNHDNNQDFYQDDAYLAVIFLTDADDVTPGLSGEDFYQHLLDLKGGDNTKVLIAAALPNLNDHSATCTKDGRGPLQSFPALLSASGAIYADLCAKDFGTRLADFGRALVQRVASQKIELNFTPDIDSLQVSYGTVNSNEQDRIQIPRGQNGYYFDVEHNVIIISPDLKISRRANSVVFVKAIPASLGNYKNGRLKEI